MEKQVDIKILRRAKDQGRARYKFGWEQARIGMKLGRAKKGLYRQYCVVIEAQPSGVWFLIGLH